MSVNSQQLVIALRLANKVVPSKPALPILSRVLLRAGEQLTLRATDLEVGLETTCDADVNLPGAVALPMAKVLALVEQFPDADVDITLEKDDLVRVRCNAFKSKLQVVSPEQFPPLPVVEGDSVAVDSADLQRLIGRTRYAVSALGTSHVLHGALLTLSERVSMMVATDGKRLALAAAPRGAGESLSVTIPSKTLDVLAGQLGEGELRVTVGKRHIFFQAGSYLLTSRMLSGEFPSYKRIVPKDNDKVATIDRLSFVTALRRVLLIAEENQAVYFDFSADVLALSSASSGLGSADEHVATQYNGAPLRVCANGRYVLDFLEAASGQTVTVALKDANSAALLTDGPDHVSVIMLMRGFSHA